MSKEKALLKLKEELQIQGGVKKVVCNFIPTDLNSGDAVVFQHHLFLVQLVPGGRNEAVISGLRQFFYEEVKRLMLRDVRMEIDWREIPVFDPQL